MFIEGVGEVPIIGRKFIPKPDIPFEPCTKAQRQRLDITSRQRRRLSYPGLLEFAGRFLDRGGPIKSWLEVSKIDANRLIMELEGGKVHINSEGEGGRLRDNECYGRYWEEKGKRVGRL